MRRYWPVALLIAGTLAPVAGGQNAPAPAGSRAESASERPPLLSDLPMDVLAPRAALAFEREEYRAALPMLREIETRILASAPDSSMRSMLGPIQERIRVCEFRLADPNFAQEDAVETAPDKREVHTPPENAEHYDVEIRLLGNFAYDDERGGNIPEDVTALDGAPVRTRGFITMPDGVRNITRFGLVPDLFSCCFGRPPEVHHMIMVRTPEGKAIDYYADEVVIEGTLRVRERKEEGFVLSVFEMEATSIRPSPR